MQDLGRSFIRDSEDERAGVGAGSFFLARKENGGAGGIGDCESVAEIFFAGSKSVEWQKMERPVGHDDQALAGAELPERRDQFDVKGFEVALRGAKERLFKFPDVFAAHAEFGELEAKQLEDVGDARKNGHGKNADIVAVDHSGEEAVAGGEIFDEGGIGRKSGLQLLDGKV